IRSSVNTSPLSHPLIPRRSLADELELTSCGNRSVSSDSPELQFSFGGRQLGCLPSVVVFQAIKRLVGFVQKRAVYVVLIRSLDVHGVRFREGLIALDDDKVLVVLATRTRGEVVTTSDHRRALRERVHDDNFAVDD